MIRPPSPPLTMVSGVTRHNSQMLKITDRLSQALHDFDKMYDPVEEDGMISSITCQIDCLESGPLKSEMHEFINRYRDVSKQSDERRTERNEVLESLMQWFSTSTFSEEFEEVAYDEHMDEPSKLLKDELLNTKVAFDKLQKLNTEMVYMQETGLDITHLERESKSLRQKAMMTFKNYKNVSVEMKQNQEMNMLATAKAQTQHEVAQVWKNSAAEIVELLSNVREEGGGYIIELEKKIRILTGDVDQRAYMYDKMAKKVKEYQSLETKWKNDNMSLMDEKATLISKGRKYKKELKKLLKHLSKYENVAKLDFLEEDDAQDQKDDSPLIHQKAEEAKQKKEQANAAPVMLGGLSDPTILKAQLRDTRNRIDQLNQVNEDLLKQIEDLKEALDDKEDDCLKLERDKEELLHQMKQNSLRPDTRRLSIVKATVVRTSSSRAINGSLTIVPIKVSMENVEARTSTTGAKKCCKCGLEKKHVATPTTNVKAANSACSAETGSEQHQQHPDSATSSTESVVLLHSSASSDEKAAMKLKIKLKEQELESLSDKCHKLEVRVLELEEELSKANEHIQKFATKLKEKENEMDALTQLAKELTSELEQRSKDDEQGVIRTVREPRIVDKEHDESSIGDNQVEERDIFFQKKIRRKMTEAYVICHRSMQTDPKMDPLGPWSQLKTREDGNFDRWTPPEKWINFDPASSNISEISNDPSKDEEDPLRQAMLHGAEPAAVKRQAEQCANMVQRELQRMNQGIAGFIEYTNTLVDKETRIMANANKELKRALTPEDVAQIHMEMHPDQVLSVVTQGQTKSQSEHAKDHPGGGGNMDTIDRELDHWNPRIPVEETVKNLVQRVGQESLITLKRAYELVNKALQNQQEEYEHIFRKIRRQPGIGKRVQIAEEVQVLPVAKRSKSHSDLASVEDNRSAQEKATAWIEGLIKSKSHVTFGNKLTNEQDLQIEDLTEPKKVATASITKKGPIMLTTTKTLTPINKQSFGSLFKPSETVGRKVKPNPLNHSKLKRKQDELVWRNIGTGNTKFSRVPPTTSPGASPRRNRLESNITPSAGLRKDVLVDFELPSDFFGEYTVAELEKKATQYVDQAKQQYHEEVLEKKHLAASGRDLLPRLQKMDQHKVNKIMDKNMEDRIQAFPQIHNAKNSSKNS